MVTSVFEIFRIGVGPSSSHTMGPMSAAAAFAARVTAAGAQSAVARVTADLFGSLALTGKGHGTDRAIILGLSGCHPEDLCPDRATQIVGQVRASGLLRLGGGTALPFSEQDDIRFNHKQRLPFHSNGMRFAVTDRAGKEIEAGIWYSIGGGAIVDETAAAANAPQPDPVALPFPFQSGADLLRMAATHGLSLDRIMLANECAMRTEDEVRAGLGRLAGAMNACIDRGIAGEGILPGGLNVRRRAAAIHRALLARQERALSDPLSTLDWVNLWALAVNEENAAGGRVVTAPTNGAAGIVPAVLRYYQRFIAGADGEGTARFLLVAAAIASLFKRNASISGAEVGCQGEVGVACSMAAAGLAAALGGSNAQVENAAEIGMEHNLGLTCDPVAGLVQVPCIERNAVGSVKAIEAARLALLGDGSHRVSLDQVIETMRRTGADMNERYKETSLGGLAVNVVEC